MSAKEAAKAETRHVLSRSLGMDLFVNVDVSEHQVIAGDVLLLCSDGLHGPVSPAEIARSVEQSSGLEQAARKLVELANENDGKDNVSVLLIGIRNVERVGMYRGRPYKLR
jgi:protein phosphatase